MFKIMGLALAATLFVVSNSYAETASGDGLKILWASPQKISIVRTNDLVDQELATLKTDFDAELARNQDVIAATNGSFFGYNNLVKGNSTKNLGPSCINIDNGKQIFPYENDTFCNTRYIVYFTNDKQVGVLPDAEFKTKFKDYGNIKYAIEGVALIYNGKAMKLPKTDVEYSYQQRHPVGKQRNGICIKADNTVGLFINTTKITLENLTKKLLAQGCQYAVNLDGGGTSSMYIKDGNQYFKSFADDTAKNNVCKKLHSKEDFKTAKGELGSNDWEGCIMNAIFISK